MQLALLALTTKPPPPTSPPGISPPSPSPTVNLGQGRFGAVVAAHVLPAVNHHAVGGVGGVVGVGGVGGCSSTAHCKDEAKHQASEYTGFERHGNADTLELKNVPEWLEEKLAKTAAEEHKDAEK